METNDFSRVEKAMPCKLNIDIEAVVCLLTHMIKTFRNKGLAEFWETGASAKVNQKFHDRLEQRLDALDAVARPEEMNLPGFDFHSLKGKPKRYSVHLNGPWCVTFEFEGGDTYRVDFEQYH